MFVIWFHVIWIFVVVVAAAAANVKNGERIRFVVLIFVFACKHNVERFKIIEFEYQKNGPNLNKIHSTFYEMLQAVLYLAHYLLDV